ncbi:DUF86 domain-containing protein [Candidatus Pacearchaeota archaeon]|nr:DUF86 domain-containing protein [Candidatus Pacearchaeota archaeon]
MDKKRILAKIDELNGYLEEIEKIRPSDIEEYISSIKDKRACERLLQISIESVIDICNLIISDLKLGLPSDEDVAFQKLEEKKVITNKMKTILINMKGFRNILVHKYGEVKDELVFENLSEKLGDFDIFKEEILGFLKNS